MPDLTPRRRPVDDASRRLKRRRLELQIMVMKTDIDRHEVEILEMEDQIARKEEVIDGLRAKIEETEQALQEADPAEESVNG